MKHAGDDALDRLEPVLVRLRALALLKERRHGVFYLKAKAFAHFHEDPSGLFVDFRCPEQPWQRIPVNTAEEVALFFDRVNASLGTQKA